MEARSTCRSRSGSLRSSAHSGAIPKAERSSSRKLQTGRIAYSHSSVKRKGAVQEIKTVISSYLISVSSSVLLLITRPYWISPCTISIAKHRPAEIAAAVIDTDLTTLASSDNAYAAFLRPCSSSRMCAGVGSHLTTAVPSPTDPNTQRLDDVILSYSSPLKLCGLCCIAGRVLTHLDDSTAEGSIPETPRLPRDGGVSATAVMAAAAAAGMQQKPISSYFIPAAPTTAGDPTDCSYSGSREAEPLVLKSNITPCLALSCVQKARGQET